jgi:prepilin-type N-terminal cleavage/methylation domain-containing protein
MTQKLMISYDNRFERIAGFTLIELMVVVAIIAVLVAIAIPIFLSSTETAEEKTDLANLRILNGITAVYRSNIEGEDPFSASENSEDLMRLLVPQFIAEEPLPQQEGNQFLWSRAEQKWVMNASGHGGDPGEPGGEDGGNGESVNGGDNGGNDTGAGLNFTLSGNNMISGFDQSYEHDSTELVIPAEINGSPINEIGNNAFVNKGLTSITFEQGIEIGNRAFVNNPISTIIIKSGELSISPANQNHLGDNTTTFITFYNGNNKEPGIYTYQDGSWQFSPYS